MKHKDFFIGLAVGFAVTYLFYKYKLTPKSNWTGDNFSKNPNDPQSQPYVMSIKG